MDKDKIKGAGDQAKGAVEVGVGKTIGDAKLQGEGHLDKTKGKIESAVGDAKDKIRDLRDQV